MKLHNYLLLSVLVTPISLAQPYPTKAVRILNRDMVSIIGSPAVRTWLLTQGAEPAPGTPEELTAFLKSDIENGAR